MTCSTPSALPLGGRHEQQPGAELGAGLSDLWGDLPPDQLDAPQYTDRNGMGENGHPHHGLRAETCCRWGRGVMAEWSAIEDMNPEGKELVLDALRSLLEGDPERAAEHISDLNDLEIVDAENAVKRILQIIGEEFKRR